MFCRICPLRQLWKPKFQNNFKILVVRIDSTFNVGNAAPKQNTNYILGMKYRSNTDASLFGAFVNFLTYFALFEVKQQAEKN